MQKMLQPKSQTISSKEEFPREVTVTIAYDERKSGQRAAQLFSSIGREQAEQLKMAVQPWRFDFLADPDWRKFATAEAQQADILVIAMANPANLSAAVEQWFTSWLRGKRGFHAAVIALVEAETEADSPHSPELNFLEKATKDAGLDFFTPGRDYPGQTKCFPAAPPQAFSYSKPYRHWGINE